MRHLWFLLALCLLQNSGESFAQQPSKAASRAEELVKQLQSQDSTVRGAAKLELKSTPSPEALPILLKALPTLSGEALDGLIEALEAYKDTGKIPALIIVAAEKGDHWGIAYQMEELGTPAAEALLASLHDTCDKDYAKWVGETIGDIGGGEAGYSGFPTLVKGLQSDNDCQLYAVAEGLTRYYYGNCKKPGERGADPAIDLFHNAATSDDPKISDAALNWINSQQLKEGNCVDLSGVVEPLIKAYQANASAETMIQITKFLLSYPSPRVDRFMRAAVHAPNPEIQEEARHYLATHVQPEVRKSRTTKAPTTSVEKIAAAERWGQSNKASNTIPLVNLLSGADPKVRVAAAAALGNLNERSHDIHDERERDQEHSIPPLMKALGDSSAEVRAAAAGAIGQIEDPFGMIEEGADDDLTDHLVALLKDPDEKVVAKGAWALGQIGNPNAIPALAVLSENKTTEIRRNAVKALGRMDDPKGTCSLVARLKDTDDDIREFAAFGLYNKFQSGERCPGDVEAMIAALGDPKERDMISMTLGRLKDPRAAVRREAILALARSSR